MAITHFLKYSLLTAKIRNKTKTVRLGEVASTKGGDDTFDEIMSTMSIKFIF
jgi:hypothetical protein